MLQYLFCNYLHSLTLHIPFVNLCKNYGIPTGGQRKDSTKQGEWVYDSTQGELCYFSSYHCSALVQLRERCYTKSSHRWILIQCPCLWMHQAPHPVHTLLFVCEDRMSRRKRERGLYTHRINPPFSVGSQTCAFCPTHYLQQLIPDIILILTWIKRRRRARGFGWARCTTPAVSGYSTNSTAGTRRRYRRIRLVMHHAPLRSSVTIFWRLVFCFLLVLQPCGLDFLPGDFSEVRIPVVFLLQVMYLRYTQCKK